jgi:pimeloyl-ACP methyl ester carboxylesterase
MTAVPALGTMVLGLAVGVVAGAALRSRWAMLLAPAVFLAVFELVRIGATGPTVDAINTVNDIALLASVTMRIVYGVLAVVPMMLGVTVGRAWVLRRSGAWHRPATRRGRVGRALGRAGAAAVALGLLLLAVGIVRPATTDPIRGADGAPLPGSIAELDTVDIGGHDQRILIRGHDVDNPVLLFLAGGPGGSELGTMARWGGLLERDFVVVTWDQRGTGASYASFEPAATLTIDQAVADTIELTAQLRDRFGTEQVYLVGNSYGTVLGVLAAQQRPDLYAAFVGTGQMVDVTETDQLFYDDAIAWAGRTGDSATVTTLEALGEPPYDDPLAMIPIVDSERRWNDYSDVAGHQGTRQPDQYLGASEYALLDKLGAVAGLADTYAVLYPQLQDVDLRTDVPQLDVPVYLVEGRHEARGRLEPAREWLAQLDAPRTRLITFDVSGHRPFVEEPERFHQVMTDTVLAETAPTS